MRLIACDGTPGTPPPHQFLHHALLHPPEESGLSNPIGPPTTTDVEADPVLPDVLLEEERGQEEGAAPPAAGADAVGVPPPDYMAALAQPKAALVTVSARIKKRPAAAEPLPAVSALAAGAPEGALDQLAPPRAGVLRPARRRRVELPPLREGERLGCSKCRQSTSGCAQCRGKLGLQLSGPGVWVRRAPAAGDHREEVEG